MRFLKSFKLLHRRTKSEPSVSLISAASNIPRTTSTLNNSPESPHAALSPAHLALPVRVFNLEIDNYRLRKLLATYDHQLAVVKAQLTATQADLFAELHRGTRQRKSDAEEITKLREKIALLEEHLIVIGTSNIPHSPRTSRVIDQALSSVVERVEANPICVFSPSLGFRDKDQYMSALQLTLKSRLQLKQCKKIVKFWKRTALQDQNNASVVTPSVSTISSIAEVLPLERQNLLHALLAERQTRKPPVSSEIPEPPQQVDSTPFEGNPPTARPPANNRPCLSPLASQSLRHELDMISSTNRLVAWPHTSKKSQQIDSNEHSYHKEPVTAIRPPNHRIQERRPVTYPSALYSVSLEKPWVDVNFDGAKPALSGSSIVGKRPELPRTVEQNQDDCSSNLDFSSNVGMRGCPKENQDDHLIPVSPQRLFRQRIPHKIKSKIPLPVFKTLRISSVTATKAV
ncbi:hypothetical protein H0H93_012899 [Arthromyces matolae]|nr:hypothetical protein H0H93_012899 [Arthromyces matolae]